MSSALRQVLQPGGALIKAGRALADPRRRLGMYAYQWLFPGPDSRQVLQNDVVPIPAVGSTSTITEFLVSDGMIFSLRAIVFDAEITDNTWVQGSGDLVFRLEVLSAGSHFVDFLRNVRTQLGSRRQPYPILGRLEFPPNATVRATVENVATVTAGAPNFAIAHLVGHTYPQGETDG